MKKEVYFGKNSLRFLYYRYKDSPYYFLAIIGFIIVSCLFLIFQVIMPQYDRWFSIRNEVEATQKKIEILKQNINYMSSLDSTLVTQQFLTSVAAMPVEKDFGAILLVVNDSALKAGVSLEDYSFQLGNIKGDIKPSALNKSAGLGAGNASVNPGPAFIKNPTAPQKQGLPGLYPINLSVTINGNMKGLERFLQEIHKKIPLAEVTAVDGTGVATAVNIRFYQKPLSEIIIQDEQPISRLSPDNQALLQKLSEWKKTLPPPAFISPDGSDSGNMPLF